MSDEEKILWSGTPHWSCIKKNIYKILIAIVIGVVFLSTTPFSLHGIVQLGYLSGFVYNPNYYHLLIFLYFSPFIIFLIIILICLKIYGSYSTLSNSGYYITTNKIVEMEEKESYNKIYYTDINDINEITFKTTKYKDKTLKTFTFYPKFVKKYDRIWGSLKSTIIRRSFLSFQCVANHEELMDIINNMVLKKILGKIYSI